MHNRWDFKHRNGESRIALYKFDDAGFSAPIVYSYLTKTVIIEMDDDPFYHFIKIDSISCEGVRE